MRGFFRFNIASLFFILLFAFDLFPQRDTVVSYYPDGSIEAIIPFFKNVRDGEARFFYPDGKPKASINYQSGKVEGAVSYFNEQGAIQEFFSIENGKRHGPSSYYDSSGNYLFDKFFVEGKLEVKEENFIASKKTEETTTLLPEVKEEESPKNIVIIPGNSTDIEEDDPAYFLSAEIMPEPVGGMENIYNRLFYPEIARKKKITGVVKIRAYINIHGDVDKTEIVEGIGYSCDEAAEIAVYYTKFKPALQRGKPVKVQMIIPIEFKLDN